MYLKFEGDYFEHTIFLKWAYESSLSKDGSKIMILGRFL